MGRPGSTFMRGPDLRRAVPFQDALLE